METLNQLLDKQIELLTDQRSTLIYAITEADENSPNYEEKISELRMEVSNTDERIDELMQRIGSPDQLQTENGSKIIIKSDMFDDTDPLPFKNNKPFNYNGIDYTRESVIKGINHASGNEIVNAKDLDINLLREITSLSGTDVGLFESQLRKAKS